MTVGEYSPGYSAIVPAGTAWRNEMPARGLLLLTLYRPTAKAGRVRCPLLVVAARDDSLVPVDAVIRTARKAPQGRLEVLPCNHFQPYVGAWFERNVQLELAFLREHLPAIKPSLPPAPVPSRPVDDR